MLTILGQRDHATDLIFKLTNISVKVARQKLGDRISGDAEDLSSARLRMFGDKEFREGSDIFGSIPKRRQFELDSLEAKIEILSKLPARNEVLQRPVCSRDNANIAVNHLVGANWLDFAFLKKPQEADLKRR
ncbi:hypothetical protein GMJLKIPL_5646 [Methylobacterium isbiliense]|uniref:Uncharacterized protein n=1 Tax=Methylobacterium isbiliense TaxID=315478 RepID=A0ABQ4SKD0_9HYPH|nr:hypothetical protein GMJLKIPL_5646 [Methylobacterium isbiliense]